MDLIGVWLDDETSARLSRGLSPLGFATRRIEGPGHLSPDLGGLVIGADTLVAHGAAVRAFRQAGGEFAAPVVAVLDRDADEAAVARVLGLADETAREPVGARELGARLRLLGRLGRALAAARGTVPPPHGPTAALGPASWSLAALERLVAGMAPEIGSPVQYVGGNLEFLANTFARLIEALDGLSAAALGADRDHGALVQALAGLLDDEELRFLLEETPAAIRESREGLDRVAAIVHCVGRLVQADGLAPSGVDVAGAVRDMLVVSRGVWKYAADVETDIEPDLPPVVFPARALCQALLALLLGAAEALATRRGGKGRIEVAACRRGEAVEVVVRDWDGREGTAAVPDGPGAPRRALGLVRSLLAGQAAAMDVLSGRAGETTVVLRLPLAPGQAAIGAPAPAVTGPA
ncbi:MAG: hypothetical protein AAGU21_19625 [Solidesulfovibrio sp.]|uniref:hypothetical protein n=1 Tax=Solidesulfovibrio sp. TaxID=2910990 RepID=UPI003158B6F2